MSFHLICPSIHLYPFIHWSSPCLFVFHCSTQSVVPNRCQGLCSEQDRQASFIGLGGKSPALCHAASPGLGLLLTSGSLSLSNLIGTHEEAKRSPLPHQISSSCFSCLLEQPSLGRSSWLLGSRRLLYVLQQGGITRLCLPCSSCVQDFHPAKLLHPRCLFPHLQNRDTNRGCLLMLW